MNKKNMEENRMTEEVFIKILKTRLKKSLLFMMPVLLLLIVGVQSCTIVRPNQRGIKVFLGRAEQNTLQPGLILKVPFVSWIETYDINPRELNIEYPVGSGGAITKDMQTVGVRFQVFWSWDESRLYQAQTRFTRDEILRQIRQTATNEAKSIIGQYSIYELVEKQRNITAKLQEQVIDMLTQIPVVITKVTISNFDWNAEFDAKIKETMAAAQKSKMAEEELKIAKTQAQTQVVEAQARLDAEKSNAEAEKIKADAKAYGNKMLAQNIDVELKIRQLEIEKIRVEKWNGVYVSDVAVMPFGSLGSPNLVGNK